MECMDRYGREMLDVLEYFDSTHVQITQEIVESRTRESFREAVGRHQFSRKVRDCELCEFEFLLEPHLIDVHMTETSVKTAIFVNDKMYGL